MNSKIVKTILVYTTKKSSTAPQKKIFPALIAITPGGKTMLEQAKPDVEKFCYVISGRVKCSIGQDVHELKMGDSIDFPVRLWRKLRPIPPNQKPWLHLRKSPLRGGPAGALISP